MTRRRQNDPVPMTAPMVHVYGEDPRHGNVPKNLTDFPSWLRTLVAIVIAAISAGAGAAIWLSSHFVSQDRFESVVQAQERTVSRADFDRHVQIEQQMVQKADGMTADFASLKTDLLWVKATLARIEEQQRKRAP